MRRVIQFSTGNVGRHALTIIVIACGCGFVLLEIVDRGIVHRAAASQDHIPLQLTESGSTVSLTVVERTEPQPDIPPTPVQRVRHALAQVPGPVAARQLQKLCGIRTAAICAALTELSTKGEVVRNGKGYQLKLPFPVSLPIGP